MRWLPFPQGVEVRGLAWFQDESTSLARFPHEMKESLPPAAYQLGMQTAGVRLRLATDSSSFAVRARYPEPIHSDNLTQFNKRGQALYVDGKCWSIKIPEASKQEVELLFFHDTARTMRELCLYLPLYGEVEILAVGVDADARIAAAKPFALPKPVVFYGTSITQGGCASRPGLSYEAIACRKLNLDYLNFGFSGNGKCELVLAETLATVDAACYVLDVGPNNPPEEFRQRFEPFLQTLVEAQPQVPVLVLEPSWYNRELWSGDAQKENSHRRETVREAVTKIAKGGRVTLIKRASCTGEEFSDCTIDEVHPNDLGFMKIAQVLIPELKQTLRLKETKECAG